MNTLIREVQGVPGAQRRRREVVGAGFTADMLDEEDSPGERCVHGEDGERQRECHRKTQKEEEVGVS